jgi:hypothetical protein
MGAGKEVTLTLYKNGFQVGKDGPLRPMDAPENKDFLASLAQQ